MHGDMPIDDMRDRVSGSRSVVPAPHRTAGNVAHRQASPHASQSHTVDDRQFPVHSFDENFPEDRSIAA
ncbi:hypothetical protein WS70_21215 [Burkholderia mayonis]|uniref:Uncharacterized protein n=1 Tax=Burkholderia mayonis TaxID=1385591 RepID=A0A1B4FL40_9BURK|nr:hypothetical protein WS70_21215 [Burkholderia mayonis]KVE43956.1 hypothetical protein WS69_22085 [Burkholderia sp. BDU5]KVE49631.1 hypothetical protein WS70_19570 [Burkholderia mayonis]